MYDPTGWAEEEDGAARILAATTKGSRSRGAAEAAGNASVDERAILGVDVAAERARAERGVGPPPSSALAAAGLVDGSSVPGAPAGRRRLASSKTPGRKPTGRPPGRPPKPRRPEGGRGGDAEALGVVVKAEASAAVFMTRDEIVAAAYAEAREKRLAADAACAAISDAAKLAQVLEDGLSQKPTTTAGRLIKAANNAEQRAEKIKAGGGGDGRALRVQGVRKSAGGGRSFSSAAAKKEAKRKKIGGEDGGGPAKPSEATLMEKSGPGAEDFEFRPPLFATPAAKAAEAYAEARRDAESAERAPEDEKDEAKNAETEEREREKEEKEDPKKDGKEAEKAPAEKEKETETDGTESAEAKAKAKAKAKAPSPSPSPAPAPAPPPKSPSPEWGDGDRVVAGDPAVSAWLDSRGWGEYAVSFAAYGATVEGLRRLTTQDLENLDVRAEVREKMLAAARGTAAATATERRAAGEKQKQNGRRREDGAAEPRRRNARNGRGVRGKRRGSLGKTERGGGRGATKRVAARGERRYER